jgi:3D-(3,5/4)-trihydroxycyclohexane-1,2-dione acylhydrolase (decyclizing)
LGVKLARPTGEVFVLVGDGGYLMNPTELVTALQEGLKITVVVSENHGFQVIRRLQMLRVGSAFGNEFRARDRNMGELSGEYLPLDLARSAEGFGARAWHVRDLEAFTDALRQARGETGPCVIVAETATANFLPGSGVWWDVAPAEVSSAPETRSLREAYQRERVVQRTY